MSGQPAARVGDLHTCPMFDGPKPHAGGNISPPGAPAVLIGGSPAARVGDLAVCMSPAPNPIAKGAFPVPIANMPAARMTDMTAHGGVITLGCPNVLIGLAGTTGNPYVGKIVCGNMAAGRQPPPNTQDPSGNQIPPNTPGQSYNNCGIESSRQIINAKGGNVSQEALMNQAISQGNASQAAIGSAQSGGVVTTAQNQAYYSGGTTSTQQVGILGSQGISASRLPPPTGAGVQISQYELPLSQGRGIIANGDVQGLPGWNQSGAHAVTVTGLEYDDAGNVTHVIYNDTGLGACKKRVTKKEFENFLSWGAINAKIKGYSPSASVATDKPIW